MKKKILLLILVLFTSFMINGCGGSFFEEESLQLVGMTSIQQPDGSTILRIEYNDSTKNIEIPIPRGTQGNGISSIVTNKDDNDIITSVTINYTDKSMTPAIFEVRDGVSINGVITETNEETGEVYLVVLFNDGTKSEPFLLPKGDKGEDGNGFTGFESETLEDGSQIYYFHFSKSEDVVVNIPAPIKGEDGLGIQSIVGTEEDGLYVIKVTYSDGTEAEPIYFNKPKDPNTWHKGSGAPESTLGKQGDYYFDITGKIIYGKEAYGWAQIITFNQSVESLFIDFYLNDDDSDVKAIMPADLSGVVRTKYLVLKNTFFKDNGWGPIPTPVRAGYIFKGWCTSPRVTATSGMFTDLTPILSDLELYAIWELIETQE